MSLGKNIARLRKEKGLTQAELGELLGVSNQAVSKWESEMTLPDVMLLPELAKVFHVAIEELYGDVSEVPPREVERERESLAAEDDRRILTICVESGNTTVKTQLPVKSIRALLENSDVLEAADIDKEELAVIYEALESTGTLVEVGEEDADKKVKITVEHYEDHD